MTENRSNQFLLQHSLFNIRLFIFYHPVIKYQLGYTIYDVRQDDKGFDNKFHSHRISDLDQRGFWYGYYRIMLEILALGAVALR